ncbi:hypothetical protein M9458_036687, partial [Cirrhinus mrigala]
MMMMWLFVIELLDVVTHTVDELGLEWDSKVAQNQAQSKLDDGPLPFFQDLHHEVSKSKQPFLVRITAADIATISKMVEHGYEAMPAMEESLAAHLAPSSAHGLCFLLNHVG